MNDDSAHIALLTLQLVNREPLDPDAVRALLIENAALRLALTRAEIASEHLTEKFSEGEGFRDVTKSELLLVRARRLKHPTHNGT